MNKILKKTLILIGIAIFALGTDHLVYTNTPAQAADSNVGNGITVDSTLDTPDDNVGDNICDDGDANCTLRAAIQEANSNPDITTISFNITGVADFTNEGEDGYTIQPTSELPDITETVTINGYSQPGSQANTAAAPSPLNGILLVELDGSNAGSSASGINLEVNSTGSVVRGLVINNMAGNGIIVDVDDAVVAGNYIGTEPNGMVAAGNGWAGVGDAANDVFGVHIGGLNAADRNIIGGSGSSGIYPRTDWIIQGNYIGVGRDGLTAIPNSMSDSAGALSIDVCSGTLVGGSEPTAVNVISGNNSKGLAPNDTTGTIIRNNFIGVGYDGVTPVPNQEDGVTVSGNNSDFAIRDNTISYNGYGGIYISEAEDGVVIGNKIMHNQYSGILIGEVTGIRIGGATTSERNIISDNNLATDGTMGNIRLTDFSSGDHNVRIQGNYIGVDEDGEVNPAFVNYGRNISISLAFGGVLIGGTAPGEGNIIAGSTGPGIGIQEGYAPSVPLTLTSRGISILGNSISQSKIGPVQDGLSDASGLGIDIYQLVVDGSLNPQSINNLGPTLNDSLDPDTGPNNYMNFPALNSVQQSGNQVTVNFDLDAADSPTDQYRVEFFANDEADPSGHGEGQTFLGAITTTNGTNKQASIPLSNAINLTGKSISATTTAVDHTSSTGFGSTSEFSRVVSVTATSLSLASTGQSSTLYLYTASILMLTSFALIMLSKLSEPRPRLKS